MSALNIQIGGEHYKTAKIQPVQYIEANDLAFLEGCVVKRVTRHNKATGKGRQDIEKAIHELQLLLELRYPLEPDRADLGDFGQQNMIAWPKDENRIDVIAQNGNGGEHYGLEVLPDGIIRQRNGSGLPRCDDKNLGDATACKNLFVALGSLIHAEFGDGA